METLKLAGRICIAGFVAIALLAFQAQMHEREAAFEAHCSKPRCT
ncbi:hypothetical protein C7399_11293 [Paraburkholderia tropica]|uniref:Uncharacterized protein n=1 Tax=Paraburkholderia tropica TaxID=92647 RepID=A0ABX5MPF3_9BURK|nr:hypothetical protein [Paraburkholderia tropica]PXX14483.1 hypothetical protein C7400_11293 [Paraburkholderia tropica]PZW79549.1 hypothetical protein C7399_11293 [Paraburkholderia tropica]